MGKVAGVDFGDRRIGIAISDPEGSMAFPREVIEWKGSLAQAVSLVLAALSDDDVSTIVVGRPLEMDGKRGKQADRVSSFCDILRKSPGCIGDVVEFDERLSSKHAERLLFDAGMNGKQAKKSVDKAAAALILQGYLDSKSRYQR